MPADERATLTLDDLHGAIRRAVCLGMDCHHTETWSQCAEIADKAMPHAEQALKEADRLAREDAADYAKAHGNRLVGLADSRRAAGQPGAREIGLRASTAFEIEAAIRASITTDEG